MLEALILPNLTCLRLVGEFDSNTVPRILSLRARSNFELSKLTFDHNQLSIPEIVTVFHLLEAFPTTS